MIREKSPTIGGFNLCAVRRWAYKLCAVTVLAPFCLCPSVVSATTVLTQNLSFRIVSKTPRSDKRVEYIRVYNLSGKIYGLTPGGDITYSFMRLGFLRCRIEFVRGGPTPNDESALRNGTQGFVSYCITPVRCVMDGNSVGNTPYRRWRPSPIVYFETNISGLDRTGFVQKRRQPPCIDVVKSYYRSVCGDYTDAGFFGEPVHCVSGTGSLLNGLCGPFPGINHKPVGRTGESNGKQSEHYRINGYDNAAVFVDNGGERIQVNSKESKPDYTGANIVLAAIGIPAILYPLKFLAKIVAPDEDSTDA